MPKTSVRNTTESDITIQAMGPKGLESATIPAGRIDDKTNKLVPGEAEVDEELIDLAQGSPVVQHYFVEGMLVAGEGKKVTEKPAKK